MKRHDWKTALVGLILGSAAFTFSPAAHAITTCSANCLIGSCSASCPGSGGGGLCGCWGGLIAICSCGGGGKAHTLSAAKTSSQGNNGHEVLTYLEGLGTPEGAKLAELTKDMLLALDGDDFDGYNKSALAFKSILQSSTSGALLNDLLTFAEGLPTPLDCETPRKTEVDVNVGGAVDHNLNGCSMGVGGAPALSAVGLLLACFGLTRRRRPQRR